MSIPPGSQWQHCRDGFSGVDKHGRLFSDNHNVNNDTRTPVKARTTATVDDKIVTDTTPHGKTKGESHARNIQGSSWKQGDFLQDFHVSKDVVPQTEDITWSSSSSDECSPIARCLEIRKRVSRESSHRNRKRLSTRSIDFSAQPQTVSPASLHLSVPDSQTLAHHNTTVTYGKPGCVSAECSDGQYSAIETILSPGKRLSTSDLEVKSSTHCNLQHRTRERQRNMSWTLSSFDDIKQMSSPTMSTLPVTQHHKMSLTRGSFSRCRYLGAGVQRSQAEKSQESVSQISDVESDTEPDSVDKDADIVGSDVETASSNSTSVDDLQQQVAGDSLQAGVQWDQEKSSQVDISSGTTSPSSSSHSEKVRASDWIKALKAHKTPEKADQSTSVQQDSAKKNRKFARGSMAEQLTRLINREKSSVRFWHHSVKSAAFSDTESRSLLLRLKSLEKQCSLFLSQCHLIVEGSGTKPCRALFASQTVHMLSLKPGMLVQVFAPWQQLEEDSGMQTFLCTHFVRICPDVNHEHGPAQEGFKHTTSTSAFWKCPCSTDAHLPSQVCPATLCPVLPLQIEQLKTASGATGCRHSATLHTVAALPDHLGVSQEPRRTLLESLERMGGDSLILPPFTATVLRVFRHQVMDTWKHRFQLLVEDAAGTLAMVRLTDDCRDDHQQVYQAEGQTYTWSHLQVGSRTNRDKDPALFRIIDKLWTGQFVDMPSQHSGSDASQIQVRVAAPGFAYVLHSLSAVACMSMDPGAVLKEASVRLVTLKEALQVSPDSRVSFVARVLLPVGFTHSHRQQTDGPSTVFVYDASVQLAGGYTAVQRVEVGRECVMETSSTGVYLFRDVSVHQGHMQCDGYTLVVEMAAWNTWSMCREIDTCMAETWTVTLPPVCVMSDVNSLVSLQGVVSAVDEDEAYSWEECETCGSDRLATLEETGAIYCTGCNSQVKSPVTRMKMKVCVTCKNCPSSDLLVQLDLVQATIESLLPSEQSDEGFDTQQVIGKPIQCPACVVLGQVSDPSTVSGTHPKGSLMLMELTH